MAPNNFPHDVERSVPFPVDSDLSGTQSAVTDVQIVTSGGRKIAAHRIILASASPILESFLDRPRKNRRLARTIPILGVPCNAVSIFVRFLYTSRCTEGEMDKYGIHLLTLSHVFSVSHLKQRCIKALSKRLTIDNVVDFLQLAKLCNAQDLYLKCMMMVCKNFKTVEKSDGWEFVVEHNHSLELQIHQFMDETDLRKNKIKKHWEAQALYLQLSEAMECLEHICTEGCTSVGPHDMEPTKKVPCSKFVTCQGLQILIRHFATCKKKVNGGCSRCKRLLQLLRLHSSICEQSDVCKVPLCRQFKSKPQLEKKGGDERWRLLVKKVVSAKNIHSLSISKRKREETADLKKRMN